MKENNLARVTPATKRGGKGLEKFQTAKKTKQKIAHTKGKSRQVSRESGSVRDARWRNSHPRDAQVSGASQVIRRSWKPNKTGGKNRREKKEQRLKKLRCIYRWTQRKTTLDVPIIEFLLRNAAAAAASFSALKIEGGKGGDGRREKKMGEGRRKEANYG